MTWRGAKVGQGTLISAINVVGDLHALSIGSDSFIGKAEIHLEAGVEIGSNVCINDAVRLITGSHNLQEPDWRMFGRAIRIRDYAWVATGAVILPGVTIGKGAVVGAHAVVARDVPDFAVATGNPARMRENARCRELHYRPPQFLAFQVAWLGRAKEVGP